MDSSRLQYGIRDMFDGPLPGRSVISWSVLLPTLASVHRVLVEIAESLHEDVPSAVVGFGDHNGVVHVRFLDPLPVDVAESLGKALQEFFRERGPIDVLVSQREPLCTVHPDCWEAGIEMRRDCYAQAK